MKIPHIITMAAVVCTIIGCKSKEEIELEKQKLEVEKLQLELQKQVLQTVTVSNSAKAREVIPVTKTYETLEMANFIEKEKISNTFEEIGFIPPKKSAYKFEKIESGMQATLIDAIGDCPAGSQWITLAQKNGTNIEFTRTVSSNKCAELTPKYIEGALK